MELPELPILYEDDDTVVINKPAGVVVNRSITHSLPTVQDWMAERLKDTKKVVLRKAEPKSEKSDVIWGDPAELFEQRVGVVHRLDQDTSGVLLLAKHPEALVFYMAQFKERQTKKAYRLLVHGKVQPEKGEIHLPIGRNTKHRLQFAVQEGGRESTTEYQVEQFFPSIDLEKLRGKASLPQGIPGLSKNISKAVKIYQGFSLVEAHPLTGRTHQLRVHFAHIKHSIVGDKTYSGSKKKVVDAVWCPRHFLHAASLKFRLFSTKKLLTVQAPLPADLQAALDCLNPS
jgi:23S rRNA pseudouridine1911/1915/1917 synthase